MSKIFNNYLIKLLIISSYAFGINPPKDGWFPQGFWDQMGLQDIGSVYGDSGWVRKIEAWQSSSFRDDQLEFNIPVLLGRFNGATTYFTAQDFQNSLFDNNSAGTMKEYYTEIRDWPHPRSIESIEHQVALRGTSVGVEAAEAFMVGRILT